MPFDVTSEASILAEQPGSVRAQSRGNTRLTILAAVLLVLFSGAIVADRVVAPRVSLNVDPAFYAVVSHELLMGKSLYTDVWDHKPPAIFVAYGAAELAFGYSATTLVILNILVSLVILFGVFYAGKAGEGGVISGLVAVALWVIVSGNFRLESRDPNTEPFINACIIWAFALVARRRANGLTPTDLILIGMMFLLASLFKPVVVAFAIFLAAAHIIFSQTRKRAIRDVFVIASVGAAGWAALTGYFAVTDRYSVFYDAMVTYNRYYSGDLRANLFAPIHGGTEFLMDFMVPLAAVGFAGLVLTSLKNRRLAGLLVAYLASSWIAIALPGRFSVHYFQLWLPPLVVGAGWAIGHFTFSKDLRFRVGASVAGALLATLLVFNQTAQYESVAAHQWTPAIVVLNAGDDTAQRINGLLTDGETFFLWGNTPNLYLLTKRRPPAAVLFDAHLRDSPIFEQLADRVGSDLARERPELLVTENGRPPVPDWITKDYEPVPIYQDLNFYSIFARRGGRIAGGK